MTKPCIQFIIVSPPGLDEGQLRMTIGMEGALQNNVVCGALLSEGV